MSLHMSLVPKIMSKNVTALLWTLAIFLLPQGGGVVTSVYWWVVGYLARLCPTCVMDFNKDGQEDWEWPMEDC